MSNCQKECTRYFDAEELKMPGYILNNVLPDVKQDFPEMEGYLMELKKEIQGSPLIKFTGFSGIETGVIQIKGHRNELPDIIKSVIELNGHAELLDEKRTPLPQIGDDIYLSTLFFKIGF